MGDKLFFDNYHVIEQFVRSCLYKRRNRGSRICRALGLGFSIDEFKALGPGIGDQGQDEDLGFGIEGLGLRAQRPGCTCRFYGLGTWDSRPES